MFLPTPYSQPASHRPHTHACIPRPTSRSSTRKPAAAAALQRSNSPPPHAAPPIAPAMTTLQLPPTRSPTPRCHRCSASGTGALSYFRFHAYCGKCRTKAEGDYYTWLRWRQRLPSCGGEQGAQGGLEVRVDESGERDAKNVVAALDLEEVCKVIGTGRTLHPWAGVARSAMSKVDEERRGRSRIS